MARRNDNSLDYWKRREAEARKNTIEDEAEYKARIEEIYKYTAANIERQVNDWYARYAKENGMFMSEAKERVRKLDMERYEALAKKYVETHDFSDQANEEMALYNLTMRINRLELLKAQINLELLAGYDDIEHELERDLIETAMKEDRRLAGILGDSVIGNERYAAQLVNASFKNATFSERLWGNNMPALRVHLEAELRNGLIQGIHPRELARRFRRHYSGSVRDTERLMTTEMCRLQTAVQKESFERNGFTEYRFITAGDGHVCPVCEDLHGQHFKVSEMQPGDNAPPMHPSCRCSTAAWMDGDKYKRWIDALANGEDVRWDEFEAKEQLQENYPRGVAMSTNTGQRVHYNEKASYRIEHDDFSEDIKQTIAKLNREIAKRGDEDGKEHGALVDLDTGHYSEIFTDGEPGNVRPDYKYLKDHKNCIFLHNHNTDTELSLPDVYLVVNDEEINYIAAVRTDGIISMVSSNGIKTTEPLFFWLNDNGIDKAIAEKLGRYSGENSNQFELERRNAIIEHFCEGGLMTYGMGEVFGNK